MKHFINGVSISPRNIDSIGFKTDFSDSINSTIGRELALNVEELTLPNEAKDIINNWVSTNGVFQGLPYQIDMNGTKIEYYIDLTEPTKYRDNEIVVKVKRRKDYDNFLELAKGTSFDLLKNNGVNFNFINIPYLIIPPNQVELGITLELSIFVMSKAIIDEINKLSELIAEVTTSIILAVGIGAVSVIGAIALAIIKVALHVAYLLLLIAMLIKLVQQLKELIFPKVRNFKGIKVKELLEKSCNYYNYQFKSTLLDSLPGLAILPVPIVKEKYKGFKSVFNFVANDLNFAFTKGYPSGQDVCYTIWTLIEILENQFNAKTRIVNGVVYLERRDYWQQKANTQILSSLTIQNKRINEYELNVFDTWKRYYLHYNVDYADQFTLDKFDDTDIEISTEPTNVIDKDLITIKGLQDRNIPFSLGVRKDTYTFIEKRVKDLFKLIDKIAKTSFSSIITNRLGVLTISNQFYGNTKLLYVDSSGKQTSDYLDKIGAVALWNNYHYINEISRNSYKIKSNVKILMNESLFVNLLNNNFVEIDGKVCEILTIEYKDRDSYALITYKEPYDYASKHTKTIRLDG